MTLKKFISFSLIIHILAVSFLFIQNVRKDIKDKPFFARLVTPKEAVLQGREALPSKIVPRQIQKEIPKLKAARLDPSITNEPPKTLSSEQIVPHKFQGKNVQEKVAPAKQPAGQAQEKGADSGGKPAETGAGTITPGTGTESKLKRKNLFDTEVIAKSVVKQEKAQELEQKGKGSVTFDVKEFRYYGYMQRLKEKIEGIWRYPPEAAQKNLYGDLYISFTIKKNGTLGSVELVRTSGHKSLDDAAMRALRDAAPFWPLPDDWKQDGLTIKGHFIYGLYGTAIQ